MTEEETLSEVELVYPLYLDVPMMTSFVAAIEDGIAYGSDVVRREDQQKSGNKEAAGGVGVPSIPILSTLFNFDLRGKITSADTAGSGEEVTLARRHTEASLFMRLRQTLIERGLVTRIASTEDIPQLEPLVQSPLLEIPGQIYRSPLNETLEAVFRMLNMLGVEITENPSPNPALPNTQGQRKGGRNKKQQQQHSSHGPSVSDFMGLELGAESLLGLRIAQRIKNDLEEAKVIDAILRPSKIEELTVVLSLALDALSEGALDNLLSGRFTVLGMVTRVVQNEDEISLYQRSALRYLVNITDLESSFAALGQSIGLDLSDSPSSIKAPALQLMPLAIYC